MKVLLIAILALFTTPVLSASVNVFAGTGTSHADSGSLSQSNGGSAALIAGIAGTQSQSSAVGGATANTTIDETGTTSSALQFSAEQGSSASAALGLAAAGSQYSAGSASFGQADGTFATIGLGINP